MISPSSMLSPTGTLTVNYSSNNQGTRSLDTPPFGLQEDIYEINCNEQIVKPIIEAI
jgi:hypothetical protein